MNDWMTADTKKYAIEKLKHLRFKVGYPSKWKIDIKHLSFACEDNMVALVQSWEKWNWKYEICDKLYSSDIDV
ncbi:MAG: hypothetical protein ACTSSP_10795, partial [Candidatus Asgardarchaeia archaeon]